MPAAPMSLDEEARVAVRLGLGIPDSAPDAEFDALAETAALICGVPSAMVALIDKDRVFIKAKSGSADLSDPPHSAAFCSYTILGDDLIVVEDTREDPRFAHDPRVTGGPLIRFYAGTPLRLGDGVAVGALCVVDQVPRCLGEKQRDALRRLGLVCAKALENWRSRCLQQQAARDLQESEARLRRLYEATPAMLYCIDARGVLVAVSDAWLVKLGYSREEVIGRSVTDFLTEPSRQTFRTTGLSRCLDGDGCAEVDYQMVRKDGAVLDVLLSAIIDRSDGAPRSLTVIEDVTLRRRAERALVTEHQRLRNIIESSGMGTWEWHIPTDELRISERWAAMMGYTTAELAPMTGSKWRALIHPDDIDSVMNMRMRHLGGEAPFYESEYRLRRRDGSWIWVLGHGTVATRTGEGAPEWMLGTCKDISLRKRHEEALRKSEEFLERTGRTAGVGGWELDLLSNELHWSAETYRIIGAPLDFQPDLDGAIERYAPASQPVIRQAVERAIATGEGWDLELQFIRWDGRLIWVRAVGAASFIDGKPVRLSGAFQDITERVNERLALQQANEHIRLATESGGIGIWHRDFVRGTNVWNDQMYRLYGLAPRGDVESYNVWQQHLHPEDRAAVTYALQQAIDGKAPYDVEYRIIAADGSLRHIRGAGRVTRDADGRPIRMVGVNWDVTDSRRLAAELTQQAERQAEASERERALFLSSPDVLTVLRVEADGGLLAFRFEAVSPVAVPMTGWQPEDLIGQRPEACLPPEVARALLAAFRTCVAANTVTSFALTLDTPNGKREFEGSLAPIRHPVTGLVIRLTGAMRDVTERKRLIAAEHHGQKMETIGRLAAGVAHDFNNILQSISSSLEMVQEELTPGTLTHDMAGIGLRAADRGSYLTHHLLSYARKQMLRPTVVELPGLLSDMRTLLQRTLGPSIAVTVKIDPAADAIKVDPGQIQTALLNLAINASHAMPNGGVLLIESRAVTQDQTPWVTLAVTDTGTGMDDATLARATEPFFTTKGLNGSGLGLSMVQGFAEQSGGKMTIISAPGQGTTVMLRLPAATAATPQEPQVAAAARQSATVLLVDDDQDVLVTTGAFLEKAGFAIIRASGAVEALGLVADGTAVDAVVTDYAMPGMNGADLVAELRSDRPGLPGIIISGFADLMPMETAADGMLATLHKPFQRATLIQALERVLEPDGKAAACAGRVPAAPAAAP